MSKTVPLSVRIPHEDAEFLARLEVDNAKTPSDKVRAIIAEHKRHSLEGDPSYSQALLWIEGIIAPISLKLRETQNKEQAHSELIRVVMEWLPDLLAHILAEGRKVQNKAALEKLEANFVDKVFRLIESVLRMGVTNESPCIDKRAIEKRIATSVQLVDVIKTRLQQKAGD